jgi:predicted phosphodiesterase
MKNILIIGDIHGCYVELLALLDKAGLGEEDVVIGIGDIVDRRCLHSILDTTSRPLFPGSSAGPFS